MFGKNKKIAELEKRIDALERQVESLFSLNRTKEQSASGDTESEAATVAQVLDEWLNGKKEGGK
mgnify:CR=1 FL=1